MHDARGLGVSDRAKPMVLRAAAQSFFTGGILP
jgi:hypothetical protein